MTREEFDKLKAAERAHLEQLRDLKQTVRQHDRRRSVVGALERLRDAARDLLDRHEDAVDELTRETAFLEARAGIELDAADNELRAADEELRALRAKMLIEEIRNAPPAGEDEADPKKSSGALPTDSETPVVEKTIGRMKR